MPPSKDIATEDPLPDFVDDLYPPPHAQLEELATTGQTPAVQSEVEAPPDAPATPSAEAPHFPWMDDVLEQLVELEAANASERPSDGPPFPDLQDELTPPRVEPDANTLPFVASSSSEVSEGLQTIAFSGATTGAKGPPGKKWRIWLATAAVLLFAALGTLQWWSHRNHTSNGPLEVVKAEIRDLKPSSPSDTSKDQSGIPAPPPPTSNSTLSQQIPSAGQTQPSGQRSVATYQLPTTGSSKTIFPHPAAPAAPSAVEKTKAGPQAARDEDQEVVVKKAIPGDLDMTKAKKARDPAAEVAWLWKATAKGNPDAPLRLADLYIKGDAVPRSCEQAVVLLKTAAINDNVRACNRLASMYAIGICVTRSHVKAYRWLSAALAADPNNQWAQQNRDLTWQQMTPEERALAEKYR